MKVLPDSEFKQRLLKVQKELNKAGLDALFVHSNEAEFHNVRYLCDYWPLFESAAVLVPNEGEPTLIIGPESEAYAIDRSKIPRIRKILEYRESAEPEYPGIPISTFEEVFSECFPGGIKKLGIAGYSFFPFPIYEAIKKATPNAEIVRADDIISNLRQKKSPYEIEMLREAARVSEIALGDAINEVRPGVTELQIVGVAESSMYKNGAEYHAKPPYIFSGKNTRHAISRASHKHFKEGEMITLGVAAEVGGYAGTVDRPVCLGKMPSDMRRVIQGCLDAHLKTFDWIKAGVPAKEVVEKFYTYLKDKGFGENILYGPCHGTGMMECEKPWMELTSDYVLEEDMTFQADTFLITPEYGLRWQDGFRVTKDGVELFSDKYLEIMEL